MFLIVDPKFKNLSKMLLTSSLT